MEPSGATATTPQAGEAATNTGSPEARGAAAAGDPTLAIVTPSVLRHVELPSAPLVLYDGTCGLCARSVRWILAHERDHDIVFAPLQGPTAALAREHYPHIPLSIDTVVYISGGRAHLRSKAFLHAAAHLRAPWRWAYALRWIPAFLLDLAYRMVAALRYRIWDHANDCGLVTPEQRRRFLP